MNHRRWVRVAESNAPWLWELVRNNFRKWCACVRKGELVTPYKLQRFPLDKLASRRGCSRGWLLTWEGEAPAEPLHC